MRAELGIWLVKWTDPILGAVIHPQGQPPRRRHAIRAMTCPQAFPWRSSLQGGFTSVAELADDSSRHHTNSSTMPTAVENPAPAVVHREHLNAMVPRSEVCGGMSDDPRDSDGDCRLCVGSDGFARFNELVSRIRKRRRSRRLRASSDHRDQTRSRAPFLAV